MIDLAVSVHLELKKDDRRWRFSHVWLQNWLNWRKKVHRGCRSGTGKIYTNRYTSAQDDIIKSKFKKKQTFFTSPLSWVTTRPVSLFNFRRHILIKSKIVRTTCHHHYPTLFNLNCQFQGQGKEYQGAKFAWGKCTNCSVQYKLINPKISLVHTCLDGRAV